MSGTGHQTIPAEVRRPRPESDTGNSLVRWLLKHRVQPVVGPESPEDHAVPQAWWKVMCLTGVDYFSTLSYLPAIAALAAGALSPLATLLIVALTLLGMLPMYRRVAHESPHGQGSVAMLENLLPFWRGKIFVLILLGFVATSWIITITLSSADTTVHMLENPYIPEFMHGQTVLITVVLLLILGGVFLLGFSEAVVVAIPLVAVFLVLNAVVVVAGIVEIINNPAAMAAWTGDLASRGGLGDIIGPALIAFPLLVLGLSGFETGVSMMPLVAAKGTTAGERLASRVRNTRRLLTTAAAIMSAYLLGSSFVTTVLIPAEEFQPGGEASGRALAYLAHEQLGNTFGTVYDVSSILILWFAGRIGHGRPDQHRPALPPRLRHGPGVGAGRPPRRPRLHSGEHPDHHRLQRRRQRAGRRLRHRAPGHDGLRVNRRHHICPAPGPTQGRLRLCAALADPALRPAANVIEKPDGLAISGFFILGIIAISLVSRIARTTELRADIIRVDDSARRFIADSLDYDGALNLIAHRRQAGDAAEYAEKEVDQRGQNAVPGTADVIFLEIDIIDPSNFEGTLDVHGVDVDGHRILRVESPAAPNAIAAILLALRDYTGVIPHSYFEWSEGNPLAHLMRYLLLGRGDTPPVVREIIRQHETYPARRPRVHVG